MVMLLLIKCSKYNWVVYVYQFQGSVPHFSIFLIISFCHDKNIIKQSWRHTAVIWQLCRKITLYLCIRKDLAPKKREILNVSANTVQKIMKRYPRRWNCINNLRPTSRFDKRPWWQGLFCLVKENCRQLLANILTRCNSERQEASIHF